MTRLQPLPPTPLVCLSCRCGVMLLRVCYFPVLYRVEHVFDRRLHVCSQRSSIKAVAEHLQ